MNGPKLHTYADCSECHRRFDLTDIGDAQEWFYGHDCKDPEPEPDPDAVPVSMCSDCYCSIANGLDSIDVSDERYDEIAAGLVWAGPQAVVDVDDEGGFSMSRCDVCGTRLGGTRLGGWIYPA